MNQEVGSIMSYLYKCFPVPVYDLELPEDFKIPSMYFPRPTFNNGNDTIQTYMKSYTINIKLFHRDSNQAYDKSEELADVIMRNRDVIPVVDKEGRETGDFIRFNRIETRIGDQGVAILVLNWDSRYYYHREEYPAIQYFSFESEVKS